MTTQVARAAYDLMHDSDEPLDSIAAWLRKSPHTLRNEVNPRVPSAKVGFVDVVEATVFTGNLVALNAFAGAAGCMVLKLPDGGAGDGYQDLAAMAQRFAATVECVAQVTADRRVSDNELARAESEAAKLIAAVQRTLQHLAQSNAATRVHEVAA